MNILAKRNAEKYPNNFPPHIGWAIFITPILQDIVGNTERALAVLLAAVGMVLLLALWGVDALRRIGPANLPRLSDIEIDGWVLAFTFGVSFIAGIVFGLAPALQSARGDVNESLKEGGRGGATAGTHR